MLAPRTSTRDRILTEASRLFGERGYDGTSTRQIADAVGIKQPSLFHHFASKQAIMEALLDLTYAAPAAVAERLAARVGPGSDAPRRVHPLGRRLHARPAVRPVGGGGRRRAGAAGVRAVPAGTATGCTRPGSA